MRAVHLGGGVDSRARRGRSAVDVEQGLFLRGDRVPLFEVSEEGPGRRRKCRPNLRSVMPTALGSV